MTFGQAIEAMKNGHRVARAGWNGKGMWIAYTPGSTIGVEQARSGAVLAVSIHEPAPNIVIDAHIDMRTASGSVQPGWLASQADMLADDWTVVT